MTEYEQKTIDLLESIKTRVSAEQSPKIQEPIRGVSAEAVRELRAKFRRRRW